MLTQNGFIPSDSNKICDASKLPNWEAKIDHSKIGWKKYEACISL